MLATTVKCLVLLRFRFGLFGHGLDYFLAVFNGVPFSVLYGKTVKLL